MLDCIFLAYFSPDSVKKGDVKTKIIYGTCDIQLLSRTRSGRWTPVQIDLSSLPPIQTDAQSPSSSPPKGRNRDAPVTKQKRLANSPLQSDAKQAREDATLHTDHQPSDVAIEESPSSSNTPPQPLNLSVLT